MFTSLSALDCQSYDGGEIVTQSSYEGGASVSGAFGSGCVSSGGIICMFVSLSEKLVSSSVEGAVGLISAW